jgi:DNA-binding transcriptional ArsR family regulator
MSQTNHNGGLEPDERRAHAMVFAALGDETRLALIAKLGGGEAYSITQLTQTQFAQGTQLTRQAITKHLRVLEGARIVRCVRAGRESRFEFDPKPIEEMKKHLELVPERWDLALARLKAFVEDGTKGPQT